MKTAFQCIFAAVLLAGLSACSPEPDVDRADDRAAVEVRGERIVPLTPEPAEEDPAPEPVTEPEAETPAEPKPSPDSSATDVASNAAIAPDTAPVAPEESAAEEFIQTNDQSYLSVGFDRLASFRFETTDDILEATGDPEEIAARTDAMIPETIRALDARSIALKGYMLPLKVEQGRVTEFLLMRDQSMCCYGTVPEINEWVSVVASNGGLKPIIDEPVTVFGKLHVGEMRENGYLVGIYRMDGESLASALEL